MFFTDKFVPLLKTVIDAHFNGPRAAFNLERRQQCSSFQFAQENCTFHLGGLRRTGASTSLMELMETYPDALCFTVSNDMARILSKLNPTIEDARIKSVGASPSIISFREALRDHWNGGGHQAKRLLILVDCGISGFDPSHIVALQKAAPQFECPFLIVLLG
jgi:hypothetical protein